MPKVRRILSVVLAVWLFVMLIAFTYTWVSRNWTPSIKSDEINIASSGALVISILGDDVYTEVSLNDVVNLEADSSFTFRQVSSQDGTNFFWKDFSPKLTDENNPALFVRVLKENDTHRKDYVEGRFCLKLDDSLEETAGKYIFIHPDTEIKYEGESGYPLNKAIRISLTFENENGVEETVILTDLADNSPVGGSMLNEEYKAVANLPYDEFEETETGALGYQTVYDLHYFDCGRVSYVDGDNESNYNFTPNGSRSLFALKPGETKWVTVRIWLEGEDENCRKEIAGEKFNFILKFDSVMVE